MIDSNELPQGWAQTSLSEIATSIGGGTPPTTDPTYWEGGMTPWVSPKDMKVFRIRQTIDSVTDRALGRLSLVPPSSVLVVVRSGILAHSLPVAINDCAVVLNQDMRAFVPHSDVNAAFVAWQLVALSGEVLERCTKDGTTVASIEASRLASFTLTLAPAAEQVRVVEAIESLLSALDAATRDLGAGKRKLSLYRQSLLKSAFDGSITTHWRTTVAEYHSAATLLQHIARRRQRTWRASRKSKYAPPLRFEGHAPFELPRGWAWASIDEVTQSSSYGTSTKCDAGAAGTPVLRIPNLRSGHINLADLKYSDSPLDLDEVEFLRPGDVLIVRTNGSVSIVGNAACVPRPGLGGSFYFASYLLRLRPVLPRLMGAWITSWLRSPPARQLIEAMAASSAGQHNIGLSALLRLPIPIAPVAEMRAALGLFIEQSAACEAHDSAIELALKMAIAQRKNILRAAFSGQLVPQDPNDEPASALLERIRAQRPVSATAAKRKPGRPAKVAA